MKPRPDLQAKTRRQLADEFGMHVNTLMRKLKKARVDLPAGLICPKEQEIIYEALGHPNRTPYMKENQF